MLLTRIRMESRLSSSIVWLLSLNVVLIASLISSFLELFTVMLNSHSASERCVMLVFSNIVDIKSCISGNSDKSNFHPEMSRTFNALLRWRQWQMTLNAVLSTVMFSRELRSSVTRLVLATRLRNTGAAEWTLV